MDREKQEKEVMEYLKQDFPNIYWFPVDAREIVRTIMRRYDLFDTEDLKRGE